MAENVISAAMVEAALKGWYRCEPDPTNTDQRRGMREALAAAEQAAWRPIEEAPRDGTQFLMLLSNGVVTIASFPRGGDDRYLWWSNGDGFLVPIADTHDHVSKKFGILAVSFRPLPASPVSCVPPNACETGESEG